MDLPGKPLNILILYTRLADYFFQGLKHLSEEYGANIRIMTYPADPNAPYAFPESDRIQIEDVSGYTADSLLRRTIDFAPDLVYITGWGDRHYRQVGRYFRRKQVPVIMGMDNPWKGTLRQKLLSRLLGRQLHRVCSHIWVPGAPQYAFASRLGFSQAQIRTGLYCARTDDFAAARKKAGSRYPKKLLFVGRFVAYKQPLELARAFRQAKEQVDSDWSLHFIGRGPLGDELRQLAGPDLEVSDFIPPGQLPETLTQYGAFCLPSIWEHWGVVVHEAAAAGMPLLLSDTVGAAADFLIPGYNGYSFRTEDETDLTRSLLRLMQSSEEDRQRMGENSQQLASAWDYDRWAAVLLGTGATV